MPGIDPVTSLAGLGVGLIGGIGQLFGAKKANQRLEDLIKQDPTYTANPQAANRLGLAQTMLNARMPGAARAEANIYGAGANQEANIERNATDSSQALSLGAQGTGQEIAGFGKLAGEEAQDYQRRYNNLVGAQEGVISEGDKVAQDKIRKFEDLAKIRGAQTANTQGAWSSLTNLGMAGFNFGLAGGFNKPQTQSMGK